jgi:DNA helicase HerA-like ATPase
MANGSIVWDTTFPPAVTIESTEDRTIAVYWGAIIPAIPDLISVECARTGMSYETALQSLLKVQQSWVHKLHGDSRFTLSLRWISTGKIDGDLVLGLVGKTEGTVAVETIASARNFFNKVRDTFPNNYPLDPCQEIAELAYLRLPFLPSDIGELGEFRREVSALQTISHDELPAITGSEIHPWQTEANNFQDLCRALLCHTSPVAVSFNLRPTQLTDKESKYIGEIADAYARLASIKGGESKKDKFLDTSVNIDKKRLEAEQSAQTWRQFQQSLRSPFELTIDILAESPLPQSAIATLQSAVAGTPSNSTQTRGCGNIVMAQSAAQKMAVSQNWADLTLHRWANTYELGRLPWLYSPEEIHSVFRLPIADRNGTWGLPSAIGATDARRLAKPINIPSEIQIGSLRLSKKQLTQHLLICGVPGSGKTNTALYLLETLWREHQIPWLVLEPAKTEYRGLQTVESLKNDLLIFSLGDERVAPFRFNPLALPTGINLDSHIGALIDLLSVSMSMWGPLPNVFEQLILEAYKRKGFTILGDNSQLQPPQFADLASLIPEIVPKLGYKKETTDEITAAISIRINKFCRGALGRMLNTRESVPFDRLMSKPVILEMSQITNSDDRAFVMGLILNRCYQYWTSRRHEATGKLKHLLLIEEAHNLLASAPESTDAEQANPKGKAVRNFANMLAEVRGFGQGIAISEQNPSGLVADIMVNTNIKLAHRIVEAKNREALGRSMLFTPQQEQDLAALSTGQMLYYIGGNTEPSRTTAPNFKDAENGFNPRLTDSEISTNFQTRFQTQYPTLYALPSGCSSDPALAACFEQGADLVAILSESPQYKSLKPKLILQLLAAPFGAPAATIVRPIFGRILASRGVNHLSSAQIQSTLDTAISLLALDAVREKGKIHGWLGLEIEKAHRLLVSSVLKGIPIQAGWIELCRIPDRLLELDIPHADYNQCTAPGVFRYENQYLLAGDRSVFSQSLEAENSTPRIALEAWATTAIVFPCLDSQLQASLVSCLAIQLTENSPEDLEYFR